MPVRSKPRQVPATRIPERTEKLRPDRFALLQPAPRVSGQQALPSFVRGGFLMHGIAAVRGAI